MVSDLVIFEVVVVIFENRIFGLRQAQNTEAGDQKEPEDHGYHGRTLPQLTRIKYVKKML